MEVVVFDLTNYLRQNIFPSKTVLVFPPFNGFRRFLIHKLIEDNFASADVAAFSIGQDINRRIVVCYKGLIRTDPQKVIPGPTRKAIGKPNMIEADGQAQQKSSPTVAVYRPPAARMAETRQRLAEVKTDLPKRCRVRRPDQQMYVPRPKRASFGDEQPRSRSTSSSRTSLENDSCDKRRSSPRQSNGEKITPECNETTNHLSNEQYHDKSSTSISSNLPDKIDIKSSSVLKTNGGSSALSKKHDNLADDNAETGINETITCLPSSNSSNQSSDVPSKSIQIKSDETENLQGGASKLEVLSQLPATPCLDLSTETSPVINDQEVIVEDEKNNDKCNSRNKESKLSGMNDTVIDDAINTNCCETTKNDRICDVKQVNLEEQEAMETVSISSDSRDSSSSTTTSSDSRDSCSTNSSDKMEVEQHHDYTNDKSSSSNTSRSQENNLKNKKIRHSLPSTNEILIISDSSTSSDDLKCSKKEEANVKVNVEQSKKPAKLKVEKSSKRNKIVNPEECDWEALYDDSGECLVPDLMQELTDSVGRVRVATADSDYRPYQSIEERSNDGECVIEIFDFPAEFKTSDLMNIFAAYRNKNFQIKWVDDTHALGVFPSPLMADEVLACTLPFVKTRPLRLGITESRNKARNLILPPLPSAERPKTCTALARRLVSGALGLRLPTSTQDREKEKQVLKEAREKRRLEAKQREAAWDGTLTSNSCI